MLKKHCLKTAIVLSALLTAGLAQPRIANAGIVADAWWALFGPPGTPYFGYSAGYSPTYYTAGYYGGHTTYYGGYGASGTCCQQRVYYVPSCSPCNSCNPCCPSPCSPCSSCGNGGPCQVPASSGGSPQTYRKESGDIQPPKPGIDDSKFESREGSKKFEKTRPEVKEGDTPPPAGIDLGKPATSIPGGEGPETREALKPTGDAPVKKGPVIKQKKPAPAKAPVEGNKVEEKTATTIDRVNYDRKITWRTSSERTRLVIRPVINSEKVARTMLSPNAGWKPGPKAPQIVQK